MTLWQELIEHAHSGQWMSVTHIARFTPAQIRETIQVLVSEDLLDLAYALGDAGLSLYPQSEDMLAISGLLALMRQEWGLAVEYLEQLRCMQGAGVQPFTYVMLVRALRCHLDPYRAWQIVREGLQRYPEQTQLQEELLQLQAYSELMDPGQTSHTAQ